MEATDICAALVGPNGSEFLSSLFGSCSSGRQKRLEGSANVSSPPTGEAEVKVRRQVPRSVPCVVPLPLQAKRGRRISWQ